MTKRAPPHPDFRARLNRVRSAARLSQTKLGKAIGVSAVMVHKWEKGKAHPDESQLAKLADALGTTLAFLTGMSDTASLDAEEAAFDRLLRDMEESSIREKNVELAIYAARQRIAHAASLPLCCVRIVLDGPFAAQRSQTDDDPQRLEFRLEKLEKFKSVPGNDI